MSYKQIVVSVEIPALIMHNGSLADPLNPVVKAMKELSSRRKKSDADIQKLADLEYRGSLYLDKKNEKVVLPGRLFEAMIAEGARKSKEGKIALSSTFVDNDPIIAYDGGPLTIDELVASPDHRLVVPVRVSTSKVIRTRPIVHNVVAEYQVSLNTDLANEAQLRRWIDDGLNQVGMGDWRPRHGRGVVTGWADASLSKKAA